MRLLAIAGTLMISAMAAAQEGTPAPESRPIPAASQEVAKPPPTLRDELAHLAVQAEALHEDLPNFTCKETAVSQQLKKKKVKMEVRFTADLRVQRGNGRSDETFRFTELNGKPYDGAEPRAPIMVQGGFDQALDYFRPLTQRCYVYTLSAGRIDFESAPRAGDSPVCEGRGSAQGFALVDGRGDVTHIERRVADADAARYGLAIFAAVDLTPVELNGRTYQLSSRMVAEIPRGDGLGRFEANYSDCRLFKAVVTIRPGSTVLPDGPAGP